LLREKEEEVGHWMMSIIFDPALPLFSIINLRLEQLELVSSAQDHHHHHAVYE